jgi:hypothetical protein
MFIQGVSRVADQARAAISLTAGTNGSPEYAANHRSNVVVAITASSFRYRMPLSEMAVSPARVVVALADAGVPMRDLVSAIAVGKVDVPSC